MSCTCKCKFGAKKCDLNQKSNNNKLKKTKCMQINTYKYI